MSELNYNFEVTSEATWDNSKSTDSINSPALTRCRNVFKDDLRKWNVSTRWSVVQFLLQQEGDGATLSGRVDSCWLRVLHLLVRLTGWSALHHSTAELCFWPIYRPDRPGPTRTATSQAWGGNPSSTESPLQHQRSAWPLLPEPPESDPPSPPWRQAQRHRPVWALWTLQLWL